MTIINRPVLFGNMLIYDQKSQFRIGEWKMVCIGEVQVSEDTLRQQRNTATMFGHDDTGSRKVFSANSTMNLATTVRAARQQ
jgi:hypothetical protein